MQERARKSPSTQEQFSPTRGYPPDSPARMTTNISHYRVSGRVATDIVFSNALLVVALWTTKEWLLSQNIGAFWVLMRVLACGALGLVFKEVASGDVPRALEAVSSAKVCASFFRFF